MFPGAASPTKNFLFTSPPNFENCILRASSCRFSIFRLVGTPRSRILFSFRVISLRAAPYVFCVLHAVFLLSVTPACIGSALPVSFSLTLRWLRLTSARSARFSFMVVVTPFGAFRADLPGYYTFLSLHLPAASITHDSVQLLGFDLMCSLTLMGNLLCSFCSSGQRFARG